eukprot:8838750-Alexandrium_andersonii.AAC.1
MNICWRRLQTGKHLASRAPRGVADCGLEACDLAISRGRTPQAPLSSGDPESARKTAQSAPVGNYWDYF